jgi:hypothetical protein
MIFKSIFSAVETFYSHSEVFSTTFLSAKAYSNIHCNSQVLLLEAIMVQNVQNRSDKGASPDTTGFLTTLRKKNGNDPNITILHLLVGWRELHGLASRADEIRSEIEAKQNTNKSIADPIIAGFGIQDHDQIMQNEILRDVYDTLSAHPRRKTRIQDGFSWTLMPLTLRLRDSSATSIFEHVYHTKLGLETRETRMLHVPHKPSERHPDFWLQNHILDMIYRAAARAWEDELLKCLFTHTLELVKRSGAESFGDFEKEVEARVRMHLNQGWI